MTDTLPLTIDRGEADSDRNPMFVLERIGNVNCGTCGIDVEDFPNEVRGWMGNNHRPAVVFQADIHCATCQPYSYDDHTLELLHTLTGEAVTYDEWWNGGKGN